MSLLNITNEKIESFNSLKEETVKCLMLSTNVIIFNDQILLRILDIFILMP